MTNMNFKERRKAADADREVKNAGLAIGAAGRMEGLMKAYETIASQKGYTGDLEREWSGELQKKIDYFLQRVEKDKGAHKESDITNKKSARELERLFDEASVLLDEEEKIYVRDSVVRGEAERAKSYIRKAGDFSEKNYGDVVKSEYYESNTEDFIEKEDQDNAWRRDDARSIDFHNFRGSDLYKHDLSTDKIIDNLSALATEAFNKDKSSEFAKTVQYYLENFNKSFSYSKSEHSNPRDLRREVQAHLLESFVNLLPEAVKELGNDVLDKFDKDQIQMLSSFTVDVLYGDTEKLEKYEKALKDLFGGDGNELMHEFVWNHSNDEDESDAA